MGYKLYRRVRKLNLPKAEKAILGIIADCADDEDGTRMFVSQATIARETGYSEQWVRKIMRQLEERGALVEMKRPGRRTSRVYRFVLEALENTDSRPKVSFGLDKPREQASFGLESNQDRNSVTSRPKPTFAYPLLTPEEEYSLSGIPRRKAPRSKGDPRVKLLMESFAKKFQARVGRPYRPNYAKDGKLLKRLLATVSSQEEIENAMDRYFADPFANKTGFDIGRFVNAFNQVNSSERSRTKNGDDEIIDFEKIRERAAARAKQQSSTRVIPPPGKYAEFD